MAWSRLSEKKYQIQIDGEYITLDVPYAKVESIFQTFLTGGGVIDDQGKVQTDPVMLVSNFRTVGNILLTKFGPTGEVVEEGNCSQLSATEISELFEVATEVLENFLSVISAMSKKKETLVTESAEKSGKVKKTKD